jgi:hypothetical protein
MIVPEKREQQVGSRTVSVTVTRTHTGPLDRDELLTQGPCAVECLFRCAAVVEELHTAAQLSHGNIHLPSFVKIAGDAGDSDGVPVPMLIAPELCQAVYCRPASHTSILYEKPKWVDVGRQDWTPCHQDWVQLAVAIGMLIPRSDGTLYASVDEFDQVKKERAWLFLRWF